MRTTEYRAIRAFEDILAVEYAAPGTVLVYSWSGESYVVDVLEERCECPDHIETLAGEGWCKHLVAVGVVTGQIELPIPPHLRVRADVSDREASRTDVLS